MLVDGKAVANDIKEQLKGEVKKRTVAPTLFIFSIGENSVSEKFLVIKKKFANDIGVSIIEKKFNNIDTTKLSKEISLIAQRDNCGIIAQLPLPSEIEKQTALNAIPPTHDVDVLSEESFKLYEDGHSHLTHENQWIRQVSASVLPPKPLAAKKKKI